MALLRRYMRRWYRFVLIGLPLAALYLFLFHDTLEWTGCCDEFFSNKTSMGHETPMGRFGTVGIPRERGALREHLVQIKDDVGVRLLDLAELHGATAKAPQWLDAWIAKGRLPRAVEPESLNIDVVMAWINGSDALHKEHRDHFQELSPVYHDNTQERVQQTKKRDREHDELRYSMRAIYQNVEGVSCIQLAASDYRDKDGIQKGLVPSWLNLSAIPHTKPLLQINYLSDFFGNVSRLPTFNSRAIESQFHNLPVCKNDAFLYLNDDMFVANKHAASDFYDPLGGLKFFLDENTLVADGRENIQDGDWNSEWPSLSFTNSLLSKRFGERKRHYLPHFGRVMSRSIMRELHKDPEFEEYLRRTTEARFRGENMDVNMGHLHHQYILEMHRLVLLWSLLSGRADANSDGVLDYEERKALQGYIGTYENKEQDRETPKILSSAYEKLGIVPPKASHFMWSSMDGVPFQLRRRYAEISKEDRHDYFHTSTSPKDRSCTMQGCVPPSWEDQTYIMSTADILQHFAVTEPSCGDCAISHLITRTSSGLEQFLPSQAHPLRGIAVEALYRYGFTVTGSSVEFVKATRPMRTRRLLNNLRNDLPDQFCINDDIVGSTESQIAEVDNLVRSFFRDVFGDSDRATPLELKNNESGVSHIPVSTIHEINQNMGAKVLERDLHTWGSL